MGGRGSSSYGGGVPRRQDALAERHRMGYGYNDKVEVPDLKGRAATAYSELSTWAYGSDKGDPGIGRISAATREKLSAREKAQYAFNAKAHVSGRWHEDASRGITRTEAERRNDEDWRREKRRHSRVMKYLGAS